MYYIGVDLGGTGIKAGLVDENGRLICKNSIPTGAGRHYAEIIKDMAMLAAKAVKDGGADIKEVKSIGIGSPGTPNNKEGVLVYTNNINFRNVPMRAEMQKYINFPVFIENDANCAALAESVAGAAKGADSSITITLGTGVGGGAIINGKIYSGFNFAGPEMGHMVIVADGEYCTCGRLGCWEAYASATAIIRETRKAAADNNKSIINKLVEGDLDRIDAKTAFDAAKQDDEEGRRIVDWYIKYLGEGITNIINMFQPEVFVIGGGVSKEGEYLLEPLRRYADEKQYAREEVPHTKIVKAQMGNDAGIIGAAMLGK